MNHRSTVSALLALALGLQLSPSPAHAAAYDILFTQKNEGDTRYLETIFSPAASSVLGFDSGKLPTTHAAGAFGLTFLGQASAASARAALDLEAGTDVQAYDEDLTSWASITAGSGWAALLGSAKPTTLSGYGITDAQPLDADLTSIAALSTSSFGRSLLAEASAATARVTLGFDSTDLHGSAGIGASETVDASIGVHWLNLDANTTLTISNWPATGTARTILLELKQDITGGRTVTWPAAVVDSGSLTITSTAGATTLVSLFSRDGGTTIYAQSTAQTGGGGASVSDTAFAASWNDVTSVAPSKGAIYDWAHAFDSDDDGKVDRLDNISAAGMPKIDADGDVTGTAIPDTDFHIAPAEVSISATTIDWSAGTAYHKTLSENTTFTFSNQVAGRPIDVAITNTASNYTAAFTGVVWPSASAPTLTTGSKTDVFRFVSVNGQIYGSVVGQNYTPPDVAAPTHGGAWTIGTDGLTHTLEGFTENMTAGAGGSGGFVAHMSGGAVTLTYFSGTGTTSLAFTGNRTVTTSETQTGSNGAYTQPGNGWEDPANNDLASFTGHTITNSSAQSGVTYVVNEGAEGTGTPAAFTDTGTIDWDNTGTVLVGTQSAFFNSTDTTYDSFSGLTAVYGFIRIRFSTLPTVTTSLLSFRASDGSALGVVQMDSTGHLIPFSGTAGSATTDALSTGVTYDIFFSWTSGGATTVAFVAATGARPTSGNAFQSKSGSSSGTAARYQIQTNSSATFFADQILADDVQIVDNPSP
jgi:hypothetical protein